MEFRPLNAAFGAECIGVGAGPPDAQTVESVRQGMARYGVLLLRGRAFEDPELADFGRCFGPLQFMGEKPGECPGIARLANIDRSGAMLPRDHDQHGHFDANTLWHIDSTYVRPGAAYSFLYAVTVPRDGGETEFCDLRLAWEARPPERRRALAPLTADHSIFHSRQRVGFDMAGVDRSALPPVARKLVRRHGPSGREALIIASHIERIHGFDDAAGQALVDELTAFATAPERTYRHAWRRGDLLIWDNRCVMHRGRPFPLHEQPRDLRSCRTVDVEDDGIAAVAGV